MKSFFQALLLLSMLLLNMLVSGCREGEETTVVEQPAISAPPLAPEDIQQQQHQSVTESALTEDMVNPGYEEKPEWFKNSFLDIRDDVAEAAERDKRVMLYFYQDGCPYCKMLLQDNFGQLAISDKTRQYFDVIAINIWGDREVTDFEGGETTEKAFAVAQRVMFTPTLQLLDEQGSEVLRINGYFPPHKFTAALDFVGQNMDKESTFREYLAKLAPEPASGKLHIETDYLQAPYQLADTLRQNQKPMLVMFEQQQCAACDELHGDILKREGSQQQLKRFDVVLLDMWSDEKIQTPDGKNMTVSDWAKQVKVNNAPSMLYFDTEGNEIIRIEAYFKSFHIQSVMDYVASGAYKDEPEFQRFIDVRAAHLRERGVEVNLMD